MKQLKCLYCNKVWYVDDIELETVNTCPFCSTTIRHKASIGNIDTLGKALYSAILVEGPESFLNREKMSGYLLDVIPNLKKEIRIFTNMFNDDYIALYRSAFHQNDGESIITINKIKSQLIDEEGLSEAWADTLCQSCLEAVSYYKGKGLSDSLDADVNDYKDEIKTRPEQINEPDSSLSVNKPSIILNSGKTEIKNNAGWSITYRIGRGIRFGRHKNGDPMHWRILAIDDNLTLVHYTGSDFEQSFHDKDEVVNWSECTLREWLNNDFLAQHFTSKEQKYIFQACIETAGIITEDKVFCLSINEVNKYKKNMKESFRPWLLRDKGIKESCVATYEHDGPYLRGVFVDEKTGIRPAMYILTKYFIN